MAAFLRAPRRDLSDDELFPRQSPCANASRREQARHEKQKCPPEGRRFRGDLGKNVWQRPRLLYDAGPRGSELGQTRIPADDDGSHRVGDGIEECGFDVAPAATELMAIKREEQKH